jgi:hypothetical protein
MWSEYGLLTQTNLHEKPGYKINVLFNSPISESFFGLNKNEKILCSIISKSQNFINTGKIEKEWTSRVYDYSRRMASDRLAYLAVFSGVLALMLAVLAVLFIKNSQTRRLYKNQMAILSTIYGILPDLVYSKDLDGR